MRFIVLTAVAVAAIGVLIYTQAAEPNAKPSDEFVRPFPIIAIKTGASDAEKAAKNEIAEMIGKAGFMAADRNPTCCIWIEITGWTPSPGEPGYFIINQGGGSIISASDEEQLKKAVEQFKKSTRKVKGGVEVPVGMMTSYRIAALGTTGK